MNPKKLWAALRIGLGWIFLWAFLDKTFGLGFTTAKEKAWLAGGSPTSGFLANAPKGPLAGVFNSIAGSGLVDWLFMLGLLLIGVALILGIAMRLAGYSGALLMLLMWLAVLPPEHNPIVDDHIIYMIALLGLHTADAGKTWGLTDKWRKTAFVKKFPLFS